MLKHKVAVISGCSRGIGKSIAETFTQNGCDLFVCAREDGKSYRQWCDELAKKNNTQVTPIFFDLTNKEALVEGMKTILKTKKPIDILVNNAGIIPEPKAFEMTSIDSMKEIFNVNYFAQIEIIQYILRNMHRNKKGSIINVSSVAAFDGEPGECEYCSSKAAVIGMTKNLARQYAKDGIRINAIAPGLIDTSMGNVMSDERKQDFIKKISLGRMGTPQEIANVALFLASDLSSYMTGQVLRVDGMI